MGRNRKILIVAVFALAFLLLINHIKRAMGLIINITDKLPKKKGAQFRRRSLSQIRQIVVHHTAGPETQTPKEVALYHTSANHICSDGCPGIAYHYMIKPNGTIYQVNELESISYHVKNNNTASIGVCFIGNYEVNEPTEEMIESFHKLKRVVEQKLGREIPIRQHKEFKATACPGRYLSARLEEMIV
jgi:hypothetical protein